MVSAAAAAAALEPEMKVAGNRADSIPTKMRSEFYCLDAALARMCVEAAEVELVAEAEEKGSAPCCCLVV